jgi:MoaA/NifB/PqqE/SkfB family radical SAM enzyme
MNWSAVTACAIHGAQYLFQTRLLRRPIPFIGGFVLTEQCNLGCEHCAVANTGIPDMTWDEVCRGLESLRRKGIRLLAITGGEPMLWRDGKRHLEDVLAHARHLGFLVSSLYTNGTLPLQTSADTVFVSIDGLKQTSERLRGNDYDKVLSNIRNSLHPNLIVNCTLNRRNADELEEFTAFVAGIPQVKAVSFYFHTPYYGMDNLFLSLEEKRPIIDRILALKRRYPICNSVAALRDVRNDSWKRPTDVCVVYARNREFRCCRSVGNREACDNCGYMGYPEILSLLKLRPSSIREALTYLPKGNGNG